jgi:RimJ/RimL family protein N-acetyltransferase
VRQIELRPLQGRWVRLEPLVADHAEGLRTIADPGLFTYLPELPDDFDRWLPAALASRDPLFYAAVVDVAALGRASFLRMDYPNGVAEIGHILWGPGMRRTPASTEAVFLMTDHLFGLGARRVEWKGNNLNEASKASALRFGFTFEGVFRQHMLVKGRNRDTAWFSLLDHEWPARRTALIDWLDRGNFDAAGRQRRHLERRTTA